MPILSILFYELITVDRIENEQVIIEWENLSLSSLPIETFPFPPKEGDQFFISGQSSSKEECEIKYDDPLILECSGQVLYLPIEIGWEETSNLSLSIDVFISL